MTGVDGANAACVKRWSGAPNESYIENFVSEDFGIGKLPFGLPNSEFGLWAVSGPAFSMLVPNITKT